MKSRESLIRLKRFQVDEKRRQVGQIELMITEFEGMIRELDVQIAYEEEKAGINDVAISPIRHLPKRQCSARKICLYRLLI